MRVLALDTALGATSAAILDTGTRRLLAARTTPMQRGHAEALVPMVRDVMAEAGIDWTGIDRIATTVGPGSFTGLRVAVAAARAFALARGLPVVGVSTLAAYAAPVLSARRGPVAVAIDARHDCVFFERFGIDGASAPAALLGVAEAAAMLAAGMVLAGNAAASLRLAAAARGQTHEIAGDQAAPDIAFVARLGAAADPQTAPALPLYLRPPSAVPQAGALARMES